MKSRALLFSIFFALSGAASADDGYTSTTGGAVNFTNNKQIEMVSERVVIDLRSDDSSIDATFHFKNLGAATTVQMGFPEEAEHGATMSHFRSEVDGKRVRVTRHWIDKPNEGFEGDDYEAVWLKRVKFAAGQERTVRVRYDANNSFLTSGSNWQEYILKTGATWAGRIEKCELVIDYSHANAPYGIAPLLERNKGSFRITSGPEAKLFPATWRQVGPKKVATTILNVEPDFNLRAHIIGGFWKFKINGQEVPIAYGCYDAENCWPVLRNGAVLAEPYTFRGIFGWEPGRPRHAKYAWGWENPNVPNIDGNDLERVDEAGFHCPNGKVIPLKHPPITMKRGYEHLPMTMIHVADVVRGLGGTCTFDKKSGYLLIDFPQKKKPG